MFLMKTSEFHCFQLAFGEMNTHTHFRVNEVHLVVWISFCHLNLRYWLTVLWEIVSPSSLEVHFQVLYIFSFSCLMWTQ
jgi:hypothetical protein